MRDFLSTMHVLALVKGSLEGHPTKYFGSILEINRHLDNARRCGLIAPGGDLYDGLTVTDAGRDLAERYLTNVPLGRANSWTGPEVDAAKRIVQQLADATEET